MNRFLHQQIIVVLCLGLGVGCSTLQGIPGRMKSMVSREKDSNDPLADVSVEVSSDFRAAKKELKSADETLIKYAQMREDMGNYDVALDRYRELLADNADNVEARLGIARIEYKNGRVHEAEQILKAAARRHPQNLQVWVDMGKIQSDRQQYGAAIQSLQKAVALDDSSQVARFELGLALARGDRLEEARSHLAFAVGESAALYNIGFVLNEAGRTEEALHFFEQTLDSFPNDQTKKSATQMVASLQQGIPLPTNEQLAANQKIPSRVLLQQSSYKEWTETPAADGTMSTTVLTDSQPRNMNQSAPPLLPPAGQSPPWQAAIQQVAHASQSPQWTRTQQPQPVSVTPSAVVTAPPVLNFQQQKTPDVSYPPQWKSAH